jgi:hypothetical protein
VLLVVALSLGWGLAVLPSYGVTVDTPTLFYAGDRTRYALGHPGQYQVLEWDAQAPPDLHHDTEIITPGPDPSDPKHYPVLPALLCSYADAIFHVKLGILNGIDGHHVGLVLLHVFSLLWFGIYATRVLGRRAGALATLVLATFPCGVGHSFNDAKDWPCGELYGVAVLAAAAGVLERRARTLVAAGVWLGLALSCKFNPVFAFATILLWTPIAYVTALRSRGVDERAVVAWAAIPYVAFAVFWTAWPWLYHGDYLNAWWRALADYVTWMVNIGVLKERAGWTWYPVTCLLTTTPPLVLVCAAFFAAMGMLRSRRNLAVWALLILWTFVPILRVAAPHANFYDANRHFIEYVPGLSAMAGAGASLMADAGAAWLARIGAQPRVVAFAGALGALMMISSLAAPLVAYHPYEASYFNIFAGGLGGAQRTALLHLDDNRRVDGSEGDFWYSSFRGALARMTAMLEPGERIGVDHMTKSQIFANAPDRSVIETEDPRNAASLLYVAPSTGESWTRIHELERERPVRYREVRGGGLIYEILGKKDGKKHELVSPHTRYDDLPE